MTPTSARTGGLVKPTSPQGKRIRTPKILKERVNMRRGILAIFALPMMLAGFVMAASPALAVSPHFISATGTVNADGSLTANFKEAGLGTNQNINYTLTAQGTATWVCVNNGGANPSAQNKTTVNGPVSASGTFNSGKNGNVTASLTVQPPPSNISCPNRPSAARPISATAPPPTPTRGRGRTPAPPRAPTPVIQPPNPPNRPPCRVGACDTARPRQRARGAGCPPPPNNRKPSPLTSSP